MAHANHLPRNTARQTNKNEERLSKIPCHPLHACTHAPMHTRNNNILYSKNSIILYIPGLHWLTCSHESNPDSNTSTGCILYKYASRVSLRGHVVLGLGGWLCVIARDWKEEVCLLLHPPCSPLSNKSFLTSPDFISQKN